ncbi:kinase-like domain-containing protein, partial [Mycena leptocephala]
EHILPLFACVHTPTVALFVTQLCPAGSLFDIMRGSVPPCEDAGRMFRQVVRGLRYLHVEKRLVHRDVKLENVLVDEAGVCRIASFGMARGMDEGVPIPSANVPPYAHAHTRRDHPNTTTTEFRPGSLPYAAPELLNPPPLSSSSITPAPAQDIWALGVMLYALLVGRLPFMDSFEPRLVLKILGGSTPPSDVSARTLDVLRGCLAPDVQERWGIERVD